MSGGAMFYQVVRTEIEPSETRTLAGKPEPQPTRSGGAVRLSSGAVRLSSGAVRIGGRVLGVVGVAIRPCGHGHVAGWPGVRPDGDGRSWRHMTFRPRLGN